MKRKVNYDLSNRVHYKLSELLNIIENISKECINYKFNTKTFYNIKNCKTEIQLKSFVRLAKLLKIAPYKLLEIILNNKISNSELKNLCIKNQTNIQYEFDYQKFKHILFKKRLELKEEGKTLESILNLKAEEGKTILEQRQVENILYNGKCSLKSYLYICEIFELDFVKSMKECIFVEGKNVCN